MEWLILNLTIKKANITGHGIKLGETLGVYFFLKSVFFPTPPEFLPYYIFLDIYLQNWARFITYQKALGNYGKYWKLNFPTTLQKTIFVTRTTGNPGYTPNTMMLRYCTLFRVWCTIYIKNSSSGGEHGNLEIEEEHGKNALDIVLHVLIKGRNEMDWMLNPIMTRL